MSSRPQIVLAFDVYGTLLSTESIAKQLAEHFGQEKASKIAAEWRKYQLEYTWRLNSMNIYEPFSNVTRNSLQHALSESRESLSPAEIDSLMASYNTLSVFPDVPPIFEHLSSASHIHACVFSNGDQDMISASLAKSPDLSPHASLFKDVVVVGPMEKFKPHPDVYHHLCKSVGKEEKADEVWLVSGNPFDVVGANSCGLKTCWVDRSGVGWVDQMAAGVKGKPTVIVKGLDEVIEKISSAL